MNSTVSSKYTGEDTNPVDEFMKNVSAEGTVARKVSKLSFDVRA